jgi:GDP-mannose 6-dehydrogenase
MKVIVFGLGYVGSVSAACLASIGHEVVGVDRDEHKVHSILKGVSPFYEPGLDDLMALGKASGQLFATTSVGAVSNADIALICVGTPSASNGNLDVSQLRRVTADIAATVKGQSKPLIVAIRSTCFPGTCEDVVIPEFAECPQVKVVSNPEFLREGAAVKDFMEPGLLVVGGTDQEAVAAVAGLYSTLPVKASLVSLRAAELIKYGCNAYHAVKIAFANEMGALANKLGVDPQEIMATLAEDRKLNSSAAYLKPGFAFGGSCLPKDLRAIVYRGRTLDLSLPLLESAMPSNDAHLKRATEWILESRTQKIGILGLAFKENTDDLRESPVVTLLESLIGKGCNLRIYDPHISLDKIYGANRNYVLNAIPHIGRLLQNSPADVTGWAECLVIAQKPSDELAAAVRASGLPVIDLLAGSGGRFN